MIHSLSLSLLDPQNISIHQEYSSISKYNDIAILELEEDVKFNLYIYPACLELDTADPPKSSKLFVAGWGVIHQPSKIVEIRST